MPKNIKREKCQEDLLQYTICSDDVSSDYDTTDEEEEDEDEDDEIFDMDQ